MTGTPWIRTRWRYTAKGWPALKEMRRAIYHLELRDHTVMVWDFHSLMLAVKFLFSVRLTDPDNPMKLCAHCGKAFIAKRADSRFCSVECRSKGRKRE